MVLEKQKQVAELTLSVMLMKNVHHVRLVIPTLSVHVMSTSKRPLLILYLTRQQQILIIPHHRVVRII